MKPGSYTFTVPYSLPERSPFTFNGLRNSSGLWEFALKNALRLYAPLSKEKGREQFWQFTPTTLKSYISLTHLTPPCFYGKITPIQEKTVVIDLCL